MTNAFEITKTLTNIKMKAKYKHKNHEEYNIIAFEWY